MAIEIHYLFFCIYKDDDMVFPLKRIYIIDGIDQFMKFEPALHHWYKLYLIMIYYPGFDLVIFC